MKHLSTARKSKPISLLCGIIGFASVLIIIFFGNEKGDSLSDVLKLCVLSIVLLSIIIFYISSQQELKNLPHFYVIFAAAYTGSLFLIMITRGIPEMTLWMAGALIIAMLFNMNLGYIVTFHFIFLASFAGDLELEIIIYLLILGTFMCLLSGYMKKITTLGYTAVIVLSVQFILIVIINNFILKNSLNVAAVYSLVSSLLSIGFSYGIYSFYVKKTGSTMKNPMEAQIMGQTELQTDELTLNRQDLEVKNESASKSPVTISSGADEWSLEEILDLEFPLLQRLRQYSMKVYEHSLLISELSQKAAIAVGADEIITRAGGLYHEIGRIENKEYVEEGVKLAEANHLPRIIADMIRQHNIKYEKPKSLEAAIVMLTISVIATKEYLEKSEKKSGENQLLEVAVPIEKIVDNVFQMRLTKGSLDESGLTLKQFNKLKEFFLQI
ncbi:MAG: HDIG domain-containing metalloprotein [Anaerocolumna sp.]